MSPDFSPLAGLIGGLLIGGAAALYLLGAGRIAGISTMLAAVLRPTRPGLAMALVFLLALAGGGVLAAVLAPAGTIGPPDIRGGVPLLIAGGVLVGFGTRLANGCTSGHGVCGLPRLSPRSIAATAVFMATAMATVFVSRHLV